MLHFKHLVAVLEWVQALQQAGSTVSKVLIHTPCKSCPSHHQGTLCQPGHCAEATNVPWCQNNTTRQIWESFAASQSLCRMWLLHNMYRTWGGTAQNGCSKTAPHKLISRFQFQTKPSKPNRSSHPSLLLGAAQWLIVDLHVDFSAAVHERKAPLRNAIYVAPHAALPQSKCTCHTMDQLAVACQRQATQAHNCSAACTLQC